MIGPFDDMAGAASPDVARNAKIAEALRVVLAAPIGRPLVKAVLRPESPMLRVFPGAIVPLLVPFPRPMLLSGPVGPFTRLSFLVSMAEMTPEEMRALAELCATFHQKPALVVVRELEAQRVFPLAVEEVSLVLARVLQDETPPAAVGPAASAEGGL